MQASNESIQHGQDSETSLASFPVDGIRAPNGDVLPHGWKVVNNGLGYRAPNGNFVAASATAAFKASKGITPIPDPEKEPEPDIDAEGDDPGPALLWAEVDVDEASIEAKKDVEKHLKLIKLAAVQKAETSAELEAQIRRDIPSLKARAKAMKQKGIFDFPEVIPKDKVYVINHAADMNRWEVLDRLFADEGPHLDTFRGRLVDENGTVFDDRYNIRPIVEAMLAAGLQGQSAATVRKSYADWALGHQRNELMGKILDSIEAHPWDGTPRLEGSLVKLFECFDTEENRAMGRYLWLSLAARIFYPGRPAPIVLSLFGAQNCGKSYFSKQICEEVMHNPKAAPVELNLSGDLMEFLRSITGNSVVANIGEMAGFSTSDLNKIKSFITRVGDSMHYKYEGHFDQLRHWIAIMDGNKYEGLQRDDTGNRRFYPMFVMQLEPDETGAPNWKGKGDIESTFRVDFSTFREDFWTYMSEAKAWLDAHTEDEYRIMVDDVSDLVKNFNAAEIRAGRGAVHDPVIRTYFDKTLANVKATWRKAGAGVINGKKVDVPAGVVCYVDDVTTMLGKLAGNMRVNADSVKRKLCSLDGATEARLTGNRRGVLFQHEGANGSLAAINDVKARLLGEDWNDSEETPEEKHGGF